MVEYAILNWKYTGSSTEDTIEEITSEDSIELFIENLEEDLENDARREDTLEMLALVNSIRWKEKTYG